MRFFAICASIACYTAVHIFPQVKCAIQSPDSTYISKVSIRSVCHPSPTNQLSLRPCFLIALFSQSDLRHKSLVLFLCAVAFLSFLLSTTERNQSGLFLFSVLSTPVEQKKQKATHFQHSTDLDLKWNKEGRFCLRPDLQHLQQQEISFFL